METTRSPQAQYNAQGKNPVTAVGHFFNPFPAWVRMTSAAGLAVRVGRTRPPTPPLASRRRRPRRVPEGPRRVPAGGSLEVEYAAAIFSSCLESVALVRAARNQPGGHARHWRMRGGQWQSLVRFRQVPSPPHLFELPTFSTLLDARGRISTSLSSHRPDGQCASVRPPKELEPKALRK